MDIEVLINEMKEVKAEHPTLELSDILKMFAIKATQELSVAIDRLRCKVV